MRRWYPALVVALATVASLAAYPRLPERVPMHWNALGEVDRYGSRLEGAFVLPLVLAVVALLIPVIPRVDPRGANYEKFRPTYHLAMHVVLTLLLGVHLLVLAALLGAPVPVARVVPLALGALLVVLGNVLPRVRSNFMFGIRTPWTLSSDRVWQRTHRVGGFLMVASGLAIAGTALVAPPRVVSRVVVGVAVGATVGTFAYSYAAWRQEQRA